jgi:hypothetical protein
MTGSVQIHAVSKVIESLYLLARFSRHQLGSVAGGRVWERRIAAALSPVGATCWQGPGTLTLFGTRGASGLRHELDSAASANNWTLMIEAKCLLDGLSKEQLCCFDRKTFDLFVARRRVGESGLHFRAVASASPVDAGLHKYGYLYGITVVDPQLIPLPVLLRVAAKPSADVFIDNCLLADLVRLGEGACGPLERKYAPDGPRHVRFDLHEFSSRDLDDLHWLHRTVSERLLEVMDLASPGHYEAKAERLFELLPQHV